MKILLDCRFQKGAGPNVQSRYLLENLIALNQEFEFIILQHRNQPIPQFPGVERIFVPFESPALSFLWVQFVLPRIMARRGVDLCHSLKHIGPLFTKIPTLIHVREVGHFFPEGRDAFKLSPVMSFYWGRVLVWAMRRAFHVFGNSQECIDVPHDLFGIPREKLSVVHNGLDRKFRVIEDRKVVQEVLSRYGLPGRYILCVGNLYPHKNYDTVLRMFAKLLQEHRLEHYQLVFVGDSSSAEPSFFQLINELGLQNRVILTSFVEHDDLVHIYNGASVLLFPPIVASFPNPTLEAMACGVPVVAVDRGAVADITGGAACLIEDPLDVDAMSTAVTGVLQDHSGRDIQIKAGFERAREFSWEESVEKIFRIYRLAYA